LERCSLRWCDYYDLPLLEENECAICFSEPKKVEMTSPGDPRPAFLSDVDLIRKVIDDQFEEGCGYLNL
jgi:phosphoadenosine phosphosulfate reductase